MTRNKALIIVLSILLVAAATALFWPTGPGPVPAKGPVPFVHYSTLMGKDFFDRAYEQMPGSNNQQPTTKYPIAGGTVNHHLLAAPLDAQFFQGLAAQMPKRVILIGPDHMSRGKMPITVSAGTWRTPYGDLVTDTNLVEDLARRNLANIEESPFDHEFSVGGLVPFIRRSLPDAEIVTIIVKVDTKESSLDALAAALPSDPDTAVVASIDFSHYLPSRAAEFHDFTNRAIIDSFDYAAFDRLEIDSPPSLRVLLKYLERRGARKATLLASTDSAKITGLLDSQETTSYLNQYFSSGAPAPFEAKTSLYVPAGKKIISGENRFMRGFMTLDDGSALPSELKRPDLAVGIVKTSDATSYYLFPIIREKDAYRLMNAAEEEAYLAKNRLKSAIINGLK